MPVFWWTAGLALLALTSTLAGLAPSFGYTVDFTARPLRLLTALLLLGGLLQVVLAFRSRRELPSLGLVVAVAVLARLPLLLATPIQEDDIYRYIWDGRVGAAGLDPYRFSPEEIQAFLQSPEIGAAAPPRILPWAAVARQTPELTTVLARVNNPSYATVYPPLAQLVFRLHGMFIPPTWSVGAQVRTMKLLLSMLDAGVFLGLLLLLSLAGKPLGLSVLYAWCPLVIKELANSGHMDALPTLFVVLALCAQIRRHGATCGVLLGLAVAAKIYAVVLLPLALTTLGLVKSLRALLACVATLFVCALLAPEGGGRREATLLDFALTWENNDAVFYWLCGLWRRLLGPREFTLNVAGTELTARLPYVATLLTTAFLLGLILIAWMWRLRSVARLGAERQAAEIPRGAFAVLSSFFLLGPLGFPWYFVWCVPLLPFVKLLSWCALPGLLSLYYLRFWYDYHHEEGYGGFSSGVDFFDRVVVSAEFLLFFCLLLFEWLLLRRRSIADSRDLSS